jgi:hypothetical protein
MVLVKIKEVKGKIRRDDLIPFRDEVSGGDTRPGNREDQWRESGSMGKVIRNIRFKKQRKTSVERTHAIG